MEYYFAPMEGVTDSIYRRVHHQFFGGVDRYYMPFFSPTIHRHLTQKEERELPMADGEGFLAIPQILTKNPEDFLWAAQVCADRGYPEVNLNVGCPSGTVVAKGKGAGMLRDLEGLERFLETVFSASPIPVSVKTRLGMEEPEEFRRILEIYNRFPIAQLIVHPRVREDYYKEPVRWEWFTFAAEESRAPICYNGNLTTREQCGQVQARWPNVTAVMLGRGLIGDPGMLTPEGTTRPKLRAFHDALYEEYIRAFQSERNAMFRMKENWHCMIHRFEDSQKLWKKLRKTTDTAQYRAVTAEIFETLPMAPALQADW